MPPTRTDLIHAIEHSQLLFGNVPGRTQPLSIPGVRGYASVNPHPMTNRVMADGLDGDAPSASIDAAIDAVIAAYAERGNGFGWIVGPSSTPGDLGERLASRGLVRVAELAGMVRTDLDAPPGAPPPAAAIDIRPVSLAELRAHTAMLARAFGRPEGVVEHGHDLRERTAGEIRAASYLAFVDDDDAPAGYGDLIHLPGTPVVLLGGAGTLERHRGRGVYRALVARRLADARAAGAEAAVIQAVRTTSAPICAALGFREICVQQVYVWTPPRANGGAAGARPARG